jgi:hypothetical protein
MLNEVYEKLAKLLPTGKECQRKIITVRREK